MLAKFPLIDKRRGFKVRPVLVLSKAYGVHNLVVSAYMTSRIDDSGDLSVKIGVNDELDLLKESAVKLYKMSALPVVHFVKDLGRITDKELEIVKKKLRGLFEL